MPMIPIDCPPNCAFEDITGHAHHELVPDGRIITVECNWKNYVAAHEAWMADEEDDEEPQPPEEPIHFHLTDDKRVYTTVCNCKDGPNATMDYPAV